MIYIELLITFFKIGALTFGGGYAMLPFIQQEVIKHNWLTQEALIDFVAVSESTPGPFAVNIATYIGSEAGGFLGALCATSGVVLPSFIIILLVAKCYESFKENKIVKGCMQGLKPCVVGMIGAALLSVVLTVFFPVGVSLEIFNTSFFVSFFIFIVAVILAFKKVHPIIIIAISAVLGIISGFLL